MSTTAASYLFACPDGCFVPARPSGGRHDAVRVVTASRDLSTLMSLTERLGSLDEVAVSAAVREIAPLLEGGAAPDVIVAAAEGPGDAGADIVEVVRQHSPATRVLFVGGDRGNVSALPDGWIGEDCGARHLRLALLRVSGRLDAA